MPSLTPTATPSSVSYTHLYTKDQVLAENDVVFSNLEDLGKVHTEHNLGDIIADAYTICATQFCIN